MMERRDIHELLRDPEPFRKAFLTHHYAIIRFPMESFGRNVQELESALTKYLNANANKDTRPIVVPNIGLVGLNRVHDNKKVFRYRRCVDYLLKDVDCGELIDKIQPVMNSLEWTCHRIMETLLGRDEYVQLMENGDIDKCTQASFYWPNPLTALNLEKKSKISNDLELPNSSPFDLFCYRNDPQLFNTALENCSQHVDPGYLTIIPCASTPGMFIRDAILDKDIAIEELEGCLSYCDCVVLLNKRLEQLLLTKPEYQDKSLAAVVHWVEKRNDGVPRYSFVYELRPAMNSTKHGT